MGPVVMVTSCPGPAPASSPTLKQPSEHSNKELVLLHEEADLRLRVLDGVFSPSSSLGMWPRDLECLGGRGGGQGPGLATLRTSGLEPRLPDTGAGSNSSTWGSATN